MRCPNPALQPTTVIDAMTRHPGAHEHEYEYEYAPC